MIALLLWIFGGDIMEATTAAIAVIALMLVLKVVTWDDIVQQRRGTRSHGSRRWSRWPTD